LRSESEEDLRVRELDELHKHILVCRLCPLSETRTNAVPGEGSAYASVMFVGEGPGRQEDLQGRPFVGSAGDFLNECLESIGLRRDEVFICNVVKCRPYTRQGSFTRDRRPTRSEIKACSPYLDRQIELIKPRIICALGDTAASYLLEKMGFEPEPIGRIHGRIFQKESLVIFPMYHPAAALYAAPLRDVILNDFIKLRDYTIAQGPN
jgi:DNA polymerase